MSHNDLFRTPFGVFRGGAKMTSLLTSRVSYPSPWARQTLPAPLKKEYILSPRYKIRFTSVEKRTDTSNGLDF